MESEIVERLLEALADAAEDAADRRDAQIVRAVRHGMSLSAVSRATGASRARIRRLLAERG